jgi:ketosteroid isomerase-like protein
VTDFDGRARAAEPEDLGRLFLERANAGDVDGVAALYETDAVVATVGGELVTGSEAIRRMYEALLANPPQFAGDVRPALLRGDLALTSTLFPGGATAEIVRRQSDGTWLWVVAQPNVTG